MFQSKQKSRKANCCFIIIGRSDPPPLLPWCHHLPHHRYYFLPLIYINLQISYVHLLSFTHTLSLFHTHTIFLSFTTHTHTHTHTLSLSLSLRLFPLLQQVTDTTKHSHTHTHTQTITIHVGSQPFFFPKWNA